MSNTIYVTDYISGERVKAGPEETEAVQVFSRRLVEEYDYDRKQIRTRPQFRIKESPSGKEKHPVDIAIFHDERQTYLGFRRRLSALSGNILIPKYYDPEVTSTLEALRPTHDLPTIGSLVDQGMVAVITGDEIGKLSYGTGVIPFIRISDISNWELKIDPKHGVSSEIYAQYQKRQDVRAGDILMVRDGTYLIGVNCMLTEADTHILFQSHLYKLRVLKPDVLSPYLLLAALNSPLAKRQVWAKRFTQDIIDTLGARIMELVLPLPKDATLRQHITDETRAIVEGRAALRQKARTVASAIMGQVQIDVTEGE